jgi:hypothetical protein
LDRQNFATIAMLHRFRLQTDERELVPTVLWSFFREMSAQVGKVLFR